MGLFRKRKEDKSPVAEKAAGKIARGIILVQEGFSRTMFRIAKDWDKGRQKLFLYLVCLAFGTSSIYSIVGPLVTDKPAVSIKLSSITATRPAWSGNKEALITEQEIQKVRELKKKLEELGKTEEGEKQLDTLYQQHPGLLDSLSLIERNYYSQKK